MARVLLAAGADPNAQDAAGATPLHRVLGSRLVADPAAMVALLLDHGADPTHTNQAGTDAIETARAQVGQSFETYFPRRQLGTKDLDQTLQLLLAAARPR